MPTNADYELKIKQDDRAALLRLWTLITNGRSVEDGWGTGRAFEDVVLRAFELEGAVVRYPFSVTEGTISEQIDGAVYSDGLTCLVESKDTSDAKNIEPIAKLHFYLMRRHSSALGIVFSRNGFTNAAVAVANSTAPKSILLWDGDEIAYALQNQVMRAGLIAKYRFLIENGLVNGNIRSKEVR